MSTILIGVDNTARSEDAIALARRLARTFTGDLIVAAVTQDRAEGHAITHRMAGLLEPGLDPDRIRTAVVPAPSPAQGLHELAEAERVALIVVGSTHTGRLGRVRPGSTGERLLQGAPAAVAVAPHGYRTRLDPRLDAIGVAYNGSREADQALQSALGLAHATGAHVQAITVIPLELYGTPPSAHAEIDATMRTALEDAVAGTDAETVVLDGRPWAALAAKSEELDLLLVGSRGYGPLKAVITGGTSGPLIHHAHCPVVVVPRGVDVPLHKGADALLG
jgi:nucleotide-binding universal stress UspA family protein